jgi:hypothetical protein
LIHIDAIPFQFNFEVGSAANVETIPLPALDHSTLLPSHRTNIEFSPLTTGIDSFSMISASPSTDAQRSINVLQTDHAVFHLVNTTSTDNRGGTAGELDSTTTPLIYASFTEDNSLIVVSDDCRFSTHFRNEDVIRAINMKNLPRPGFGWEQLVEDEGKLDIHQETDGGGKCVLPPQGEMFMNSLACYSRNPESGIM